MSNYNVGDKFVIEVKRIFNCGLKMYGIGGENFISEDVLDEHAVPFEECRPSWHDEIYNRGLNDAWEAAKRICLPEEDGGFSIKEMREIFGSVYTAKALKSNTASEAITKIREFDEKKAENAKIKVGDVVVERLENAEITFVVCSASDEWIYGITKDGKWNACGKGEARKTGRHFPEIAKVLEAMKNEANNPD